MEHQQQQLLHLPPHQQQLMLSPGFFDAVQPLHFHDGGGGGFVEPAAVIDDGGWMEDLMQLGEQLFGGGNGDDNAVEMVGGPGARHQQLDVAPASPEQPCSYEYEYDYDDDVSPPLAEQGAGEPSSCEPNRDDSDPSAKKRRDRSKTIVSERKRRFRMKEKLYELRALVPNITKMDKASIIADALMYIKNLQSHAKKLKEDVAALEARPASPGRRKQQQERRRGQGGPAPVEVVRNADGGGARVTQVSAVQVGEGRFFVTVECERLDGVAAPLCAAVESLAGFRVESSTLGWLPDRVVSTLTLKVRDVGKEVMISEGTVKLWMMAALQKEGFRPEATVAIA